MSLIKPGISMINIEEVTNYLNEDKIISLDTKNVSGIKSEQVAVAALDENGEPVVSVDKNGVTIPERHTVKNALMLGGLLPSDYLNKEEAEIIDLFANNISRIYAEQIQSLREELYLTKAELEKRGYIKDLGLLDGMYDNFNENILKLNTKSTGITQNLITASNNVIPVADPSIFSVGDLIAIVSGIDNPFENENYANDTTKCYVSMIVDITGNDIRIDLPVPPLRMSDTKVFKSLGTYSGGNMLFSKVGRNVANDEVLQLTLLDDTNNQYFSIAKPRTGLASTLRIPPYRSGAIDSLSIKGRVVGNPGDLICYIIEEKNLDKFINIEMVNENDSDPNKDKIVLARSIPISSLDSFEKVNDSTDNSFFKFDFRDPITGKLPIIKTSRDNSYEENKRHCFVVVCDSASENNKWDIVFSAGAHDEDFDTTKTSYRFEEIERSIASNNIILGIKNESFKEIDSFDMNFILNTRKLEEQKIMPYNRGLYTAKINKSDLSKKSIVRVSMRALREGLFRVSHGSEGIFSGSSSINIDRRTSGSRTAMSLGENIIIGSNSVTCSSSNINSVSFETKDGAFIEIDKFDKVYRNGYKVQLKASNYEYQPLSGQSGKFEKIERESIYVDVPLCKIIKDSPLELDERYTDRLIYQCETPNLNKYEDFEIQISWATSLEVEDIANNNDFAGGISELSVSISDSIYSD